MQSNLMQEGYPKQGAPNRATWPGVELELCHMISPKRRRLAEIKDTT